MIKVMFFFSAQPFDCQDWFDSYLRVTYGEDGRLFAFGHRKTQGTADCHHCLAS
jgi:hypothetical protein